MKSSRLEEDKNIEGNIRNLFGFKKTKKKKQLIPQLKIYEIFLD